MVYATSIKKRNDCSVVRKGVKTTASQGCNTMHHTCIYTHIKINGSHSREGNGYTAGAGATGACDKRGGHAETYQWGHESWVCEDLNKLCKTRSELGNAAKAVCRTGIDKCEYCALRAGVEHSEFVGDVFPCKSKCYNDAEDHAVVNGKSNNVQGYKNDEHGNERNEEVRKLHTVEAADESFGLLVGFKSKAFLNRTLMQIVHENELHSTHKDRADNSEPRKDHKIGTEILSCNDGTCLRRSGEAERSPCKSTGSNCTGDNDTSDICFLEQLQSDGVNYEDNNEQ